MRLLFVPFFVILTVTGYAEQHIPSLSLAPLPASSEQTTIRGQSPVFGGLSELLSSPPPIARGPAEVEIEPKLTETLETPDVEPGIVLPIHIPAKPNNQSETNQPLPIPREVRAMDPMGYGALLVAMVCTTIGLILMVYVAYDYRQRWMQSLTMQNDRYVGGTFEMELDDWHGGSAPVYEGYALPQRSI